MTKDSIKVTPFSTESEQAVIGALMLDNESLDKIIDLLAINDFYHDNHQIIYSVILWLNKNNKPFDVLTLSELLKERKELDRAGGEIYLFEIAKNTPSTHNIFSYAETVQRNSVFRQLISTANSIAESCFNAAGRSAREILDDAERKIFKIAESGDRQSLAKSPQEMLPVVIERIDLLCESKGGLTGIATGFDDLDKITHGLQKSNLIIVAARPSMGKTVLAVNMAEHVALKLKKPVLMFSLEMSYEDILLRTISSVGRLDHGKIMSGQLQDHDFTKINEATNKLYDSNFYIDDTASLTPTEMRARARRFMRAKGEIGLIVIDYLQMMRVGSNVENRAVEISEISRSLKSLAKELKVPVLAISQLNRSSEHRTDRKPVMSDLRDSGSIEQDADLIMFIYREEQYNADTPDKNIAEIIISKHRNGATGKINLTFNKNLVRFDNYVSGDYYKPFKKE